MAFALYIIVGNIVGNIVYNELGCGVAVTVKCNIPMYLVAYLLYSPQSLLCTLLGVLAVCPQAVKQWKNCMSALHMS